MLPESPPHLWLHVCIPGVHADVTPPTQSDRPYPRPHGLEWPARLANMLYCYWLFLLIQSVMEAPALSKAYAPVTYF